MRDGEIALPAGIAGVGLGEPFSDGQRGLEALQGVGEVALSNEHVADPLMRDGEVALPLGISRLARGQSLG